jgi:hypothetical protein
MLWLGGRHRSDHCPRQNFSASSGRADETSYGGRGESAFGKGGTASISKATWISRPMIRDGIAEPKVPDSRLPLLEWAGSVAGP